MTLKQNVGKLLVGVICLQAAWVGTATAAELKVAGKISEVTVYRDQARVVREMNVPAGQELQQIRVTGLPSQLAHDSAFTESAPGTTVRSMRVVAARTVANPDYDQQMEQLRAKQKDLQKKLRGAEQAAKAIEQDLLTIDKLVDFSADKVKENLDRATLDVQSVTALADFTMQRRRQLAEEFLTTQEEIEQLKSEIEENSAQQRKLTSSGIKTTYEALLTVVSPDGGMVRLAYDVGGVQWSPRYSVRSMKVEAGKRTFSLQLDAQLIQDSGEPWNDAQLTLSTSTPDSQAARPLLTPLRVHAVSPGEQPAATGLAGNEALETQPAWLDEAMMQRNVPPEFAGQRAASHRADIGRTDPTQDRGRRRR